VELKVYYHKYTPPKTKFGEALERIALIVGMSTIPFGVFSLVGQFLFDLKYRWALIPTAILWIILFIYIIYRKLSRKAAKGSGAEPAGNWLITGEDDQGLTLEERNLLVKYRNLDQRGRYEINTLLDAKVKGNIGDFGEAVSPFGGVH
jgi:hypothetical protein